jgi:hypothetical protein
MDWENEVGSDKMIPIDLYRIVRPEYLQHKHGRRPPNYLGSFKAGYQDYHMHSEVCIDHEDANSMMISPIPGKGLVLYDHAHATDSDTTVEPNVDMESKMKDKHAFVWFKLSAGTVLPSGFDCKQQNDTYIIYPTTAFSVDRQHVCDFWFGHHLVLSDDIMALPWTYHGTTFRPRPVLNINTDPLAYAIWKMRYTVCTLEDYQLISSCNSVQLDYIKCLRDSAYEDEYSDLTELIQLLTNSNVP